MKRFKVCYEICEEVRYFIIDAMSETDALDACYCENAMGEEGEDTYEVHFVREIKASITLRDRECGHIIDSFNTLKEAREVLARYEKEDKADGNYTPNFYEIYDMELEEVVE